MLQVFLAMFDFGLPLFLFSPHFYPNTKRNPVVPDLPHAVDLMLIFKGSRAECATMVQTCITVLHNFANFTGLAANAPHRTNKWLSENTEDPERPRSGLLECCIQK